MTILRKINNALRHAEEAVVVVLLSVMVVLAFYQVAMRNLASGGFVWGDILLRHIVLWLGFLGGALATSYDRHINIDAFAHFMPERAKQFTAVVTNLFAAAVCVILLLAAVTFVKNEIDAQSTVYESVPAWYTELIIPIGFGLHAVHFVLRAAMKAVEALKGQEAAA